MDPHSTRMCFEMGKGADKDMVKAAKYRMAAKEGNADAQFNLGICYYIGSGVKQDPAEAAKWFRKAAEQGVEQAKTALNRLGAQ